MRVDRHRKHRLTSRGRFARPAAIAAAICLVAGLLALPSTGASFTATSANTANVVGADTLDPPTALAATSGVTISLDWTATSDAYATGHRILRSASAGGPYTQIAEVTPTTTTTFVDTPPEGTYYYVARAYADTWESATSAETSARAWRPFDCPADPDLRACIRFDNDLGGIYLDESGYANTVSHSGGSQVPGISGQAAQGSPTARYEMADSPSLDLTDASTIEAWVRFDSLPTSGRVGLVDNDGQYSLIYFAGSGLRCDSLDDLPHVPVPVGVWFHVACTWDGTTLTMYYDGVPVGTMPSTGGTIDTTNTEPVALLNTSPLFDEPFDGALDNVRIWHSGRTQAQICTDAGITGC